HGTDTMARPSGHFPVLGHHHSLSFAVVRPVRTDNGPIGARVLYVSAQQRSVCLKRGFHLWTSAQVRQHSLRSNPARYSTNLLAQHKYSPSNVSFFAFVGFDSKTLANKVRWSRWAISLRFGVRPLLDLLESGISMADPIV